MREPRPPVRALQSSHLRVAFLLALGACAVAARADIDANSGIDLVRIGSPGNAPWPGNGQFGDEAIGRGSVAYEYGMGRLEVTTAQFAEFFNAAYDRAAPLNSPFLHAPSVWGAVATTPINAGGFRWTVPAGSELPPVGGISWRTAAMYCNWLNNNKSSDASAFLNGAYDVSTFSDLGTGFSDQVTHNARARYWIPTWDEYIKAAHFDPNRSGPGQGGYWVGNYTLTHFAVPGPPGTGEANYGFGSPAILLGSYPGTQSAFGLLDLAGGMSEWTEGVVGVSFVRRIEGSAWSDGPSAFIEDAIYNSFRDGPAGRQQGYGFRISSSVPAPAPSILLAGVLRLWVLRKRSTLTHAHTASLRHRCTYTPEP